MKTLVESILAGAIKSDIPWFWSVEENGNIFYVRYSSTIGDVYYGGGVIMSGTLIKRILYPKMILNLIQYSVNATELGLRESGVY